MGALGERCEIRVVSLSRPNLAYNSRLSCQYLRDPDLIATVIDEFRPDVLHGHYLTMATFVANLARRSGIPFTVRTHSFDTLATARRPSWRRRILQPFRKARLPRYFAESVPAVNDDLCLGILAFPFLRPRLEGMGFRSEKIHDCYPVVNYARFFDPSPNGTDIMNVGACLPKKKMEDYLQLAQLLPEKTFNLYALGYETEKIARLNKTLDRPVRLVPPVDPAEMPRHYKTHGWLVYTASREMGTVGWPVAIAEAQASGVGVCMPNLRPDLRDYVGPAGFLYDSIADVARIVSRPFPDERRQLGFEQARKSDIAGHLRTLTDLWPQAAKIPAQPLTSP